MRRAQVLPFYNRKAGRKGDTRLPRRRKLRAPMSDPYRADLAFIHDAAFGQLAEHAAPVLLAELRRGGYESGLVVDLGCGSGILAQAVAAAGFEVVGIDLSPAMIELARGRVPCGTFHCESIRTASIPPCVAVAVVGEGLNYLFDRGFTARSLGALLRRIGRALAPGGVLLCDVAGPGRVPGPGPRRVHAEGPGWAILADVEEDRESRRLTRRITTFRQVGELYRRDHEVHRQRLFPRREVTELLRGAGFRVRALKGYGELEFPPGLAGFLARKR